MNTDKVSKLEEEQLDDVQGGSLVVGTVIALLGVGVATNIAGVAIGICSALGLFKKKD